MAKTRIEGSADCGNSPKNKLAQDIAVGLETNDLDADLLGDEVVWRTSDGQEIAGADAIIAALGKLAAPKKVSVDHAISHGKVGASNGVTTTANGDAQGFAHVITFTSTSAKKIARIESYRTA